MFTIQLTYEHFSKTFANHYCIQNVKVSQKYKAMLIICIKFDTYKTVKKAVKPSINEQQKKNSNLKPWPWPCTNKNVKIFK